MKTYIKIVFKNDRKCLFGANTFLFTKDGFCDLELNEENERKLVASVSMDEIKYLIFVDAESKF